MAKGKKTGGRPKGGLNKATTELKDMIAGALNDVGGQAYLREQALANPNAFIGLLGKILPRDIKVGGDPTNPVQVNHAASPAAVQAINDLIGAVTGARAIPIDPQADPQ